MALTCPMISASVVVSSEEVASSQSRMGASFRIARAMATLCVVVCVVVIKGGKTKANLPNQVSMALNRPPHTLTFHNIYILHPKRNYTNSSPLPLPAREFQAAFADAGVVPLGHAQDGLVDARLPVSHRKFGYVGGLCVVCVREREKKESGTSCLWYRRLDVLEFRCGWYVCWRGPQRQVNSKKA